MNRKILLFILMVCCAPAGALAPIDAEESMLVQKIEEQDWTFIRTYMSEELTEEGSIPRYTFVLMYLIAWDFNDLAIELIQTGVLERVDEDDYIGLIETSMVANKLAMVEFLLQQYESLSFSAPADSMDGLFRYALSEKPDFIPLLLDAGIDPNEPLDDESPLTFALGSSLERPSNQSTEHYAENLQRSGTPEQRAEIFWQLVRSGANVDLAISRGEGIFAEAARLGNMEIFNYLIQHGAKVDDSGKSGTALMVAAAVGNNYMGTIPWLLDLGADVCLENRFGETAYDLALITRIVEAAKTFPQLQCKEKIHFAYAGYAGDLEIMESLLQQGADVNDVRSGDTALIAAAAFGDNTAQSIPFLLDHEANICAKDGDGFTAYEKALTMQRTDVLRNFPQLLCAEDMRFYLAGATGDIELMQYMLDRGADINSADRRGRTALMSAIGTPNQLVSVPYLLNQGADVCGETKDGTTAYETAVAAAASYENGYYDPGVALQLIKENPALFCPGKFDFLEAINTGDVEVVEFQLMHGAGVNEPNS
jgi:ankyrin repeat protein